MSDDKTVGLLTETFKLPSGASAEIRELTGREEDLMLDERVVKSGKLAHRILGNTIVSLNGAKPTSGDVMGMWAADRFAALMFTRVLTYGSELRVEHECDNPECKSKIVVTATLPDDLKFVPYSGLSESLVELPNGNLATIRPLKGTDEENLAQARNKGELMTEVLFSRTISITGIESRQELRTFLRDAPARVRRAIRDALDANDFGYAQSLDVTCPHCGTEQQVGVVDSRDFFFPKETE